MATITSDTINPRGAPVGNVTVTEPVYANLADGRTILAAVPGDDLSDAEAANLGVGPDGKSTNGVTPPDSLEAQMAVAAAGAAQTADAEAAADTGAEPEDPFLAFNAKDAAAHIATIEDIDELDRLADLEEARDDGGRKSVVAAFDKRAATLNEGGDS